MASEQMQAFLDEIKTMPQKVNKGTFEEQRKECDDFFSGFAAPGYVLIDEYSLAGRPARKYFTSGVREDATLLYLHGGGYTVGSLNAYNAFMAHLAVACESSVNGLEYRLAPENPYPAALDDAIAAYKEILQYTPAEKIMIAGDSAGGGLALASLLRIKDEGLQIPGCAALLSPATDLTAGSRSLGEEAEYYQGSARIYAGDYPLDTPGISPLFGDLEGLPPLLIQAAKDEAMVDDSTRLAERARAAGVSVEIKLFDEAFHVFQLFTHFPEAQVALSEIGDFYRSHI